MLSLKTLLLTVVTVIFSLSAIAQSTETSQAVKDVEKLKPALKEVFKLRDLNGDGLVNGTEYESWGSGAKHYDLNKDGTVDATEYAAYFEPKAHAKNPAPAKVSSTAAITKLPAGKYTCFGYGLNASGGSSFSYVYKGHFFLAGNNKYTANNTSGTYLLTTKAGTTTLTFKNGAYDGITGEVTLENNEPRIVLTWPPAKPGGTPSKQYCRLTK